MNNFVESEINRTESFVHSLDFTETEKPSVVFVEKISFECESGIHKLCS